MNYLLQTFLLGWSLTASHAYLVKKGMFECDSEVSNVQMWSWAYEGFTNLEGSCSPFDYCDAGVRSGYVRTSNDPSEFQSVYLDVYARNQAPIDLRYSFKNKGNCKGPTNEVYFLFGPNTLVMEEGHHSVANFDNISQYDYDFLVVNPGECLLSYQIMTTTYSAGCNRKLTAADAAGAPDVGHDRTSREKYQNKMLRSRIKMARGHELNEDEEFFRGK